MVGVSRGNISGFKQMISNKTWSSEQMCENKANEIRCHVHPRYIWLKMLLPVLVLVFLFLVLNFAYIYPDMRNNVPWLFSFEVLSLHILLAALVLVPSYIWIWLNYQTFIYIVKKDELVIRKGLIHKRHNSIPYNKIRNVQRLQSIPERLFGLCTLSIETAGISMEFPDSSIPGILNSEKLPEVILTRMHANQDLEGVGNTMRQILSQLKNLNERDQRKEDLGN